MKYIVVNDNIGEIVEFNASENSLAAALNYVLTMQWGIAEGSIFCDSVNLNECLKKGFPCLMEDCEPDNNGWFSRYWLRRTRDDKFELSSPHSRVSYASENPNIMKGRSVNDCMRSY